MTTQRLNHRLAGRLIAENHDIATSNFGVAFHVGLGAIDLGFADPTLAADREFVGFFDTQEAPVIIETKARNENVRLVLLGLLSANFDLHEVLDEVHLRSNY